MKCPKCSYERQVADDAPAWQCPACGVAYNKVLKEKVPATGPLEADDSRAQSRSRFVRPPPAEPNPADPLELQELAARGQKIVIRCIALNFILHSAAQAHALPALAIDLLTLGLAVYSLFGILGMCTGIGRSQNQKILFMVLSFFPFANLVALVYLSHQVTKALRKAGWTIGLMGAKP